VIGKNNMELIANSGEKVRCRPPEFWSKFKYPEEIMIYFLRSNSWHVVGTK
jgi:hypothetical protein